MPYILGTWYTPREMVQRAMIFFYGGCPWQHVQWHSASSSVQELKRSSRSCGMALVLYRRRDSDHFDDILLAQKRMAAVGRAPAAPWTRARVIYSLVKKLEVLGLSSDLWQIGGEH